jgi:hypothetical protein
MTIIIIKFELTFRKRVIMKFIQKFICLLFALFAFNRDVTACDKMEVFWANTTSTAMKKLAELNYPAIASLDAFMLAVGDNPAFSFGLINTSALPGGPASSGVLDDDIQEVINHLKTVSPSLGQATTDLINYINRAAVPLAGASVGIVYDDLQAVSAALNAFGSLGGALNQEFIHVGTASLPGPIGPIVTTGVLATDINNVIAQMNPGSASLGAAVAANTTSLGVAMLPGGPASTGIVRDDIIAIKAAINGASGDLGSAVTSVSNLIDPTAASLFAGITGVNTVLGNAIGAADAKGKADAILFALNNMTGAQAGAINAGVPHGGEVSIQAWFAFFGIPI